MSRLNVYRYSYVIERGEGQHLEEAWEEHAIIHLARKMMQETCFGGHYWFSLNKEVKPVPFPARATEFTYWLETREIHARQGFEFCYGTDFRLPRQSLTQRIKSRLRKLFRTGTRR